MLRRSTCVHPCVGILRCTAAFTVSWWARLWCVVQQSSAVFPQSRSSYVTSSGFCTPPCAYLCISVVMISSDGAPFFYRYAPLDASWFVRLNITALDAFVSARSPHQSVSSMNYIVLCFPGLYQPHITAVVVTRVDFLPPFISLPLLQLDLLLDQQLWPSYVAVIPQRRGSSPNLRPTPRMFHARAAPILNLARSVSRREPINTLPSRNSVS